MDDSKDEKQDKPEEETGEKVEEASEGAEDKKEPEWMRSCINGWKPRFRNTKSHSKRRQQRSEHPRNRVSMERQEKLDTRSMRLNRKL